MKTINTLRTAFFLLLALIAAKSFSQDTIHTINGQKIQAKVTEIGETEIKYKLFTNMDGPVIVMYRNKVNKIRFENGAEMKFKEDDLDVNQERKILDKKSVYKFSPFGVLNQHYTFGYERVLKTGINLDAKLGIIAGKTGNGLGSVSGQRESGFFIKPGVKFLLGSDVVINGMKYAHPLKGRYIKLEPVFTMNTLKDYTVYRSVPVNGPYGTYYDYVQEQQDVRIISAGGHIIYGRQFVLGNIMTVDYFIGLGVTSKTVNYKGGNSGENNYIGGNYLHSHLRANNGLSFTWGLSLGLIGK